MTQTLRILALFVLAVLASPALAFERHQPGCEPEMAGLVPRIVPAALTADQVRLDFIGHSTFLIETAKGVTIETDYNDYARARITPTVATMNRAHDTHFSNRPEPGIAHILRGWNEDGSPADFDMTIDDVRIRNVVTNIRLWGTDRTLLNGNSIFIFETAGLCIAHLGHLHHELEPEHFRQLGRVDVLLMPVDGNYTMGQEQMFDVARRVQARLMIPMHYFGPYTLDRFLDLAGKTFPVQRSEVTSVTVSRDTLPQRPTILVLPGR